MQTGKRGSSSRLCESRENYCVVLNRFVIRCCKTRQNQWCWYQCHLSRGKTVMPRNVLYHLHLAGIMRGLLLNCYSDAGKDSRVFLQALQSWGSRDTSSCFILQAKELCQHWLSDMACWVPGALPLSFPLVYFSLPFKFLNQLRFVFPAFVHIFIAWLFCFPGRNAGC